MSQRAPWSAVLTFVAVGLAVSLLLVVIRRPPLTVEEVMRNGGQLADLAARTTVLAPASEAATQVTYTFDGPCGDVLGLALLNQWTRQNEAAPPEAQLWFSLQVREGRWSRGPELPPMPAVSLIRHDEASDLVAAGEGGSGPGGGGPPAAGAMAVAFRAEAGEGPEPGASAPGAAAGAASDAGAPGDLVLDNLSDPEGTPFDQVHGLAPAPTLASVHCKFDDRDLRLFALLARVLRARICDAPEEVPSRCYDTSVAIYRAAPGGRYWIELRGRGEDLGMLAVLLDVTFDRGVPWRGRARIIRQRSNPRRAADLFFVHPRAPGTHLTPADPGFRHLAYRPPWPPGGRVEVDFAALLGDTAWLGAR